VGCLTAVGKLALTASAFVDGGASLGLEAELEGGSLLAEEGLNVAADEGGSLAAEDAGADAGTSVFRTPRLGQGDSELNSGLNPANHVEGDQSAYVGTENVAQDFANPKVGGYENGYVKYEMTPEFDSEFAQYKFPYVTTSGETGSERQIPLNMIDRFNELTLNRSRVPWGP